MADGFVECREISVSLTLFFLSRPPIASQKQNRRDMCALLHNVIRAWSGVLLFILVVVDGVTSVVGFAPN